MNIEIITNLIKVLDCIPMELEIYKKSKQKVLLKNTLTYIQQNLDNPNFRFWMVTENSKIIGYCFAVIIDTISVKAVYILRVWTDPKIKNVSNIIWDEIVKWAKENSMQTIRVEVEKNMRAFEKKWGFTPVVTVMERRI